MKSLIVSLAAIAAISLPFIFSNGTDNKQPNPVVSVETVFVQVTPEPTAAPSASAVPSPAPSRTFVPPSTPYVISTADGGAGGNTGGGYTRPLPTGPKSGS